MNFEDRVSENTNRKLLEVVEVNYDENDEIKSMIVDVSRSEGEVTTEGTPLNKEGLEDALSPVEDSIIELQSKTITLENKLGEETERINELYERINELYEGIEIESNRIAENKVNCDYFKNMFMDYIRKMYYGKYGFDESQTSFHNWYQNLNEHCEKTITVTCDPLFYVIVETEVPSEWVTVTKDNDGDNKLLITFKATEALGEYECTGEARFEFNINICLDAGGKYVIDSRTETFIYEFEVTSGLD